MTVRLSRASKRQVWRRAHVLPVAAEFLAREETIARKLTWGLERLKEGHDPSVDLAEEVDRLEEMIPRFEILSSRLIGRTARELMWSVRWLDHDFTDLLTGNQDDRPDLGSEPEPQDKRTTCR